MDVSLHEQFLVDLAQWMARVRQYSARHPACAQLGEKTHASLRRALERDPLLTYGILRDNVLVGETALTHPAIRTRIAPHLHERGVLVVRFTQGTGLDELTSFVDLLTLPVQSTFDRGGLMKLASERGIARIQLEEIAHDITIEEREAQTRRLGLRSYFIEELQRLLASREGLTGEKVLELLEHPELGAAILEEDPHAVAEAFAGLCLMVRQEEQSSGKTLFPKLKAILMALSPASHDRVILGFPALVGDFRQALAWAFGNLDPDELARVLFPAFRRHAVDTDVVFYATSAAIPHDGRRFSALRRMALYLHDLPLDDLVGTELLQVLARPVDDFDSYRRERVCVSPHAERILASRTPIGRLASGGPAAMGSERPVAPFDGRRIMTELVKMASRTRRFDKLCEKLPAVTTVYAASDAMDAVAGLVRGLREVNRDELKPLAQKTLQDVASPELTARLLGELDGGIVADEGAELDDLVATVKLLVSLAPAAVFERLEASENRKMRRILLDAIAAGGPSMVPLVKAKLTSPSWFVVRNAVLLLPRLGTTAWDLKGAAHHPNEKVRLEVVRSLRAMPQDEASVEIIASYIVDSSPEVRKLSLPMLRGDLLTDFAVEGLAQVASTEKHPEELRRRVIDALGRSARDSAASALFELLQPKGLIDLGSLRDVAASALRRSPAPRAAELFQQGLHSSSFRVRKACERALGSG